MSNVLTLSKSYGTFFNNMRLVAASPFMGTYLGVAKCGENDWAGVLFWPTVACIVLSPVLIPLTAVTSVIALGLSLCATLSMAVTYPVAAVMDCCENSEREAKPLLMKV